MSRVDEAGTAHAKYSASESKRWLNCPGSVDLCEGLPDVSGDAAKQGTCAHHLVNFCLHEDKEAATYLGYFVTLHGEMGHVESGDPAPVEGEYFITVDDDCVDAVQVMLDTVAKERERLGPHRMVLEHRFNLGWLRPDMFGTADVALIQDFGELVIIDYKHGEHIGVEVEDNTQTKYYAVGVLHDEGYDFTGVKTIIVQPRKAHPDGAARDHSYTVAQMREFEVELGEGVDATQAPNATLRAGEWCFFCKAGKMGKCPMLRDAAFEAAQLDFSAAGTPEAQDVPSMNEDEMVDALKALPVVRAWCRGVEARLKMEVIARGRAYGKKVVRKMGRRAIAVPVAEWVAAIRAAAEMPELVLTAVPKPMSPSQVEKLKFGKRRKFVLAEVAKLTHKPPAGLAIVNEDDDRYEEVTPEDAAGADFEAIMPGDEE